MQLLTGSSQTHLWGTQLCRYQAMDALQDHLRLRTEVTGCVDELGALLEQVLSVSTDTGRLQTADQLRQASA